MSNVPTFLFWFADGQFIPELGQFTDFGIRIPIAIGTDFGLVEENLPR